MRCWGRKASTVSWGSITEEASGSRRCSTRSGTSRRARLLPERRATAPTLILAPGRAQGDLIPHPNFATGLGGLLRSTCFPVQIQAMHSPPKFLQNRNPRHAFGARIRNSDSFGDLRSSLVPTSAQMVIFVSVVLFVHLRAEHS